jgi:hypothetical protein
MVAYSFKPRFVEPIREGRKRQTVRGNRRRHARPGELIQLYCGQRTRSCFKIGEARCVEVKRVVLRFGFRAPIITINGKVLGARATRAFARADGFSDIGEFAEFWREQHGAPDYWEGMVIYWEPLATEEAAA